MVLLHWSRALLPPGGLKDTETRSEAAHRRTVKIGDGWHGSQVTPDEAQAVVARLRRDRPEPEFTISIRSHWDGRDVGMMKERVAAYGQIDTLVNNAAALIRLRLVDFTEELMQQAVRWNVWNTLRCCKAVVPHMTERGYGRIVNIGASVDPNTRRVSVRSEVRDPKHELRSGMFATFVIRTGMAVRSPAVPLNGVIREGDGTMAVWVTTDRKRLVRRTVKVGLEQDGFDQILEGLQPGELVATEGALFLSNALTAASR